KPGMAQRRAAPLRADDQAGGGVDRGRLSVRHQHAPGATGTRSVVPRRGIEGHGEPDLAEGADGLGGMVPPLVGCRGHCSVDPGRLHEEISADYNDMIYASTPKEIEARRKSFIRSGG